MLSLSAHHCVPGGCARPWPALWELPPVLLPAQGHGSVPCGSRLKETLLPPQPSAPTPWPPISHAAALRLPLGLFLAHSGGAPAAPEPQAAPHPGTWLPCPLAQLSSQVPCSCHLCPQAPGLSMALRPHPAPNSCPPAPCPSSPAPRAASLLPSPDPRVPRIYCSPPSKPIPTTLTASQH